MENGILHIDMNNFYASVETLYAPELKNVPMAVAGDEKNRHGIILAKNMLAKQYGVQTAEPIGQALKKCPGLTLVPPHHDRYHYFSRRAKAIYCEYTDRVESFGLDECWLDVYGSERLFGDGEKIAYTIKDRIRQELGLTVSVGVSFNKIFAKLGSDYKKPDAVTVFGREQMESVIWQLPCDTLLFVGPSTRKALDRLGLYTIGDVARAPLPVLRKALGRMGETLWMYANGKDDSPVRRADVREEAKSIGNSVTLPYDITTEDEVRRTLLSLAQTVAGRLRAQGMKAGEVQLTVKRDNFEEIQRQMPVTPEVCDSQSIYKAALELYHREHRGWAIRLLGIRVSRLVDREAAQLSFFDAADGRERREKLETAVDSLKARFGKNSVSTALNLEGKERKDHGAS